MTTPITGTDRQGNPMRLVDEHGVQVCKGFVYRAGSKTLQDFEVVDAWINADQEIYGLGTILTKQRGPMDPAQLGLKWIPDTGPLAHPIEAFLSVEERAWIIEALRRDAMEYEREANPNHGTVDDFFDLATKLRALARRIEAMK